MKKYRILTLTDHSGHSDQNSVYPLLQAIVTHEQCSEVYVASRGIEENNGFFKNMESSDLKGKKIDQGFDFGSSITYYCDDLEPINLRDFDILFLRLPRPITDKFLIWLDKNFNHGLIINDAIGIIKTSSKEFLLNFPTLCPSLRLCHSISDVLKEVKKHAIVLKPLREYGGKGILKIDGKRLDDGNEIHDTETYLKTILPSLKKDGYLAMKFLKNVTEGDKRILVVDGEILGSSVRIPAEGSWLCNVAQGGRAELSEVTKEEREIIRKISPKLRKTGIFMYGVDTLVEDDGKRVLSEINTLSIGGFVMGETENGNPIIQRTIEKLFRYADEIR